MTGSAGPPGGGTPSMTTMQILLQQQVAAQQDAQYTANQQTQMVQQWATPMGSNLTVSNHTITTTTTTGNPLTWITTKESPSWQKEYEVTRIVKRAKNGYFFIISVDETDYVFYRVWKGGWFPYLVAKTLKKFARDIDGNKSSWNSVPKRSHLPATLGSAYERIDKAIKEDINNKEHDVYVRDLLTTKPENLKMIGSLEKLAEGGVDATEHEAPSIQNAGSSNASSPWIAAQPGNVVVQPGNMLAIQSPAAQAGTITGVSTLEAKNIILNGTDIVETIDEKLREVTAIMEERLEAMKEYKDELAKAP